MSDCCAVAVLEFGENTQHLKHRLAGRRRGVEALLAQELVDLERVQLRQETDQILQAATFDGLQARQPGRGYSEPLAHYLGHLNLQSTARYTALAPDRFARFWQD
jgi:hypothetical protein